MNTLHPFILPVPPEIQSLKGRERSNFLSGHARRAVRMSAEICGAVIEGMQNGPDGSPIPENGIYWSVSHKPRYVAGVVAEFPVGIDLEPIRPVDPKLFDRMAGETERSLAGDPDLVFCRSWTAREAVVKATGGRYPDIFRCRVVEIPDERHLIVSLGSIRFYIEQQFFDGHIAAVVTGGLAVNWSFGEA